MRQKHPPRTAPSRSAWRGVITHTPCHHTCNGQDTDLAETFNKIGRLDAIQPTYPCKQGRREVTDRQRRPLSNHGGERRQPHTVLHRIAAATAERDDAAVIRPRHEGWRHHAPQPATRNALVDTVNDVGVLVKWDAVPSDRVASAGTPGCLSTSQQGRRRATPWRVGYKARLGASLQR